VGAALATLFSIAALTFFLMHAAPGGPFSGEKNLDPTIVENLNSHFGLDQPPLIQFARWLGQAALGNFGPSFTQPDRTAWDILRNGLPASLLLGVSAFFFSLGLGTLLGIIAAICPRSLLATTLFILTSLALSLPSFLTAALLQYFLAFRLGLMPPAGFWDQSSQLILPVLTLSVMPTAFIARLVRGSLLQVQNLPFLRTARAKGLGPSRALWRHGLRHAFVPVVAYSAPLAASLLTGSFIVETIFAIPGLGRAFVTSVSDRDYTVIMALTLVYSAVILLLDTAADSLARWLDPRTRPGLS
jgi:oligopeptide transport system permease protein